tara:strand:+ start:22331 stop:23923 length:1593 start_codon:yes stop_codon:yes gene_type:complete
MPKVATYSGPQVSTEISRGARAGSVAPGAFGGDIGGAVQQLGQEGLKIAQRIDTTAAEEASVNFERDKNNLFFDPDTGYFNKQGKTAYEGAGGIQEELENLKRKYSDTLTSPGALAAFDKVSTAQITRSNVDIQRHAAKGLQSWEVATINSQVENTIENASLYHNDPKRLDVQRVLGRAGVLDAAEMQGIGAEATAEKLQTFESSFNSTAINAATRVSSVEGQLALDKYGKNLEGPDRIKIEDGIVNKAKAEKTASDASLSVLKATQLVSDYDKRADINEQLNTIEDPELRSKTRREAMWQFDQKTKAQEEERGQLYEDVENHILDGKSPEAWIASNPEGWDKLSPKQKSTVLSGKSVTTNHGVLSELLLRPKQDLAQVNPSDFFNVLAPADRNKLTTAVKAARGERADDPTGRTRAGETTATMTQLFGKSFNKLSNSKQATYNAVMTEFDNELTYREGIKGSLLTSQEYTAMLGDFTRKVVIEGTLWDSTYDVEDIPAEDMPTLSKFLRANGIPVTSDNLIKAYRQASD